MHRTNTLEKLNLTALGRAIEEVGRLVGQLADEPANDTAPKPVPTADAAQALGVTGRTLHRWADQGCPSIRTAGGKRRWVVTDVRTWLDAREGGAS